MDIASTRKRRLPLLLAALIPLAPATGWAAEDVNAEISAEMAKARKEVRQEMAAARAELETSNLDISHGLRFGTSDRAEAAGELPKAEITPRGDFLIEGKPVAVDGRQRSELLAYRRNVLDIAGAGMAIGEQAAAAALDVVDRGLFSLIAGALTGSLERRVEQTVKQSVEPGVRQICQSLPALHASQQKLAGLLPEFKPYATLEADDVDDCEQDVSREFAGI